MLRGRLGRERDDLNEEVERKDRDGRELQNTPRLEFRFDFEGEQRTVDLILSFRRVSSSLCISYSIDLSDVGSWKTSQYSPVTLSRSHRIVSQPSPASPPLAPTSPPIDTDVHPANIPADNSGKYCIAGEESDKPYKNWEVALQPRERPPARFECAQASHTQPISHRGFSQPPLSPFRAPGIDLR